MAHPNLVLLQTRGLIRDLSERVQELVIGASTERERTVASARYFDTATLCARRLRDLGNQPFPPETFGLLYAAFMTAKGELLIKDDAAQGQLAFNELRDYAAGNGRQAFITQRLISQRLSQAGVQERTFISDYGAALVEGYRASFREELGNAAHELKQLPRKIFTSGGSRHW